MKKRSGCCLGSLIRVVSGCFCLIIFMALLGGIISQGEHSETAVSASIVSSSDIPLKGSGFEEHEYTATGKGTKILEGLKLAFSPSRLYVKSDKEIKVTLCTDNGNKTYDGSNSSKYQFVYVIDKQIEISQIMVETQGEWMLELSNVRAMEQPNISGSGSFVTGSFVVSPPSILSISFDKGRYGGYTYIYLYKMRSDGHVLREEWMWQDIVSDESFDYIIKPEANIDSYFLQISCPHDTKWEITTLQ